MRDFSRRTEKIAICRGEWEISRSVAENVKNRDLSRRIGNFAVSYMPRNPFVPGTLWVFGVCIVGSVRVHKACLGLYSGSVRVHQGTGVYWAV